MSLQSTPRAERTRIGIFGARNAGKSSLINALTAQDIAIVSDAKGTTTDPVSKAMEILPLGPVLITDTPGLDDTGDLGALRVARALETLAVCDIVLHVVDAGAGEGDADRKLASMVKARALPYLKVYNKVDTLPAPPDTDAQSIAVSCKTGFQIPQLREQLAQMRKTPAAEHPIIADLLQAGDTVVLVTPIDSSAPKGRLILPQQMTIREIIDVGAIAIVVQPAQLRDAIANLKTPPRMVVTDSQAFGAVSKMVARDIPLTSFSILMARHKGILGACVHGARHIDTLQDGDQVLISEGCTHHKQCEDIGSVKIPHWLRTHTGRNLTLSFTNGAAFPQDVHSYALIVHCGGCMLHSNEVLKRLTQAQGQDVAITNYGILIAHINGILPRVLEPLEGAY